MIEIVTLFLSLVYGQQLVELDVSPEVAAVEIVLDGESVGRLDGPPWSAFLDLGSELLAHKLEAVAFDVDGVEIDRAVRILNLGHLRQAGRMTLLEDDDGRPRAVSLGWESVGQREDVLVEVYFDGEPVAVQDPRQIPLPAYSPEDFHVVSAVFHFQDGGTSNAELGFGGRLGLEVSSELTALVVSPAADAKPPRPEDLAAAFRVRGGGQPLQVHGVEKSPAEVVLVRDLGAQPAIDDLVRSIAGAPRPGMNDRRGFRRAAGSTPQERLLRSDTLSRFAHLPPRTSFRSVAPNAALLRPAGISTDMFVVSPPIGAAERGLLAAAVQTPPQQFEQRLAAAVGLAGLIAQGTQRPRAVILILGGTGSDVTDVSDVSPETARAYLRDLGVPLYVWSFEPLPEDSSWGTVRSLGPPDDLRTVRRNFSQLTGELADDLERQRLVWLRGSHLPREIEVAPGAQIEIAGR